MNNKSKTYVYPLVHYSLGLSMFSNLDNTYVYNSTVDNVYTLVYEFEEEQRINNSINFIKNVDLKLKESALLVDIEESDDKTQIAYIINIPPNLQESFDLFKAGLYSKLPEKAKYQIVDFNKRYYPSHRDITSNIASILFKNPEYRERLSQDIGYNIPEEVELSSKPVMKSETFSEIIFANKKLLV